MSGKGDSEGEEPVRKTWYGMNQRRPRLPYYLRLDRPRLKSLNEYEEPEWKGRMRWAEDDQVTAKGVARETLQWLLLFAIVAIVGGIGWMWFAGADGCAEVVGGVPDWVVLTAQNKRFAQRRGGAQRSGNRSIVSANSTSLREKRNLLCRRDSPNRPRPNRQEAIMRIIDDHADLPCFRADLETA